MLFRPTLTPPPLAFYRRYDIIKTTIQSVIEGEKSESKPSAGAICWFALGNTDSPGFRERGVNRIEGLGFVNAYFSPHCQIDWKRESEIRSLRHIGKVGLSVSNCSAVEIVGD